MLIFILGILLTFSFPVYAKMAEGVMGEQKGAMKPQGMMMQECQQMPMMQQMMRDMMLDDEGCDVHAERDDDRSETRSEKRIIMKMDRMIKDIDRMISAMPAMMSQRMMGQQAGKPEKGKEEDSSPAVPGTPQGNTHQHQ